jgi:hypothetical protein
MAPMKQHSKIMTSKIKERALVLVMIGFSAINSAGCSNGSYICISFYKRIEQWR